MGIIQNIKDRSFKKKLESLGFDMEDKENKTIAAFGFTDKVGMSRKHFVKCMEDGVATKRLQQTCELVSGRKDAGRYLQREPLVIQCGFCQKDFAIKDGVKFAGATINLKSLENIMHHLISCEGVLCDCGNKVFYFDKCKKCKRDWKERSAHLKDINKEGLTKKQKQQIKEYKIKLTQKTRKENK